MNGKKPFLITGVFVLSIQSLASASHAQQAADFVVDDQRALEVSSSLAPALEAVSPSAAPPFAQGPGVIVPFGFGLATAAPVPAKQLPFKLGLFVPVTYTDNAFRTDNEEESDYFISPRLSFGYIGRLGQRGELNIGTSISTDRYQDNSVLDRDFAAFAASYAYKFGKYRLSASYAPTLVYDTGFDDQVLAVHPLSSALSARFGFEDNTATQEVDYRTTLTPTLAATRILTDPSDFDRTQLKSATEFATKLTDSLSLSTTPSIAVSWYDDFFEDTFDESRRDIELRIDATITWRPVDRVPQLALAAGVGFIRNYSTLDESEYDRFEAAPKLGVELMF